MTALLSSSQALVYDGKTSELYKIYALNFLLNLLTLGLYSFWGKTRKRRYITSSFQLAKDRFEYTGYGNDLMLGLFFGCVILIITSLPLIWAASEIHDFMQSSENHHEENKQNKAEQKKAATTQAPIKTTFTLKSTISNGFSAFTLHCTSHQFLIKYEDQMIFLKYQESILSIKLHLLGMNYNLIGPPLEAPRIFLLHVVVLVYLIFYFVYLPFVIVYCALRYRVSHLRWRGIRGHIDGSSLYYGLIGLIHATLKIITLGFWTPIADAIMHQRKTKKFYFGNQQAHFQPPFSTLLKSHLVTLSLCFYLAILGFIIGYQMNALIYNHLPQSHQFEYRLLAELLVGLTDVIIVFLIWLCYAPRYWYRATLLREKYNQLKFGPIGFICNATGKEYLKLFILNDFIFVFTLGLGLPIIWQRRMKFFAQHVRVTGNLNQLSIEQAKGKKAKLSGGYVTLFNLEIGLI